MMVKLKNLSVFFPAYNEEANITSTVKKALDVLPKVADEYEVIIVNDGSSDKTGAVIDNLAKEYKFIKAIHHKINQGYGAALTTGLYESKYEWIAFTDSDGQFDFSEIEIFLPNTDQCDIIAGYRIDRQDPILRKIFGWGWTFLANLLLDINVRDVDCAFKLINRKVIESIPKLESKRGGMISPELLGKAKKAGFKICEVGVHHFERKEGKQSGANIKVIFNSFFDLFKLWQKINSTRNESRING